MMKLRYVTILKICFICIFLFLISESGFLVPLKVELNEKIYISVLMVQPVIICCIYVLSIRHVILVGKPRVRLGIAFRAITLSQGLNLVLPVRLSEFLKATYLRDHANVPLSNGLSAVVLERVIDMLIVAMLGGIGVIQYFDRGNFLSIPVLGLFFSVFLILLVRSPIFVLRSLRAFPSERLVCFLEKTYQHFSLTTRTKAFWQALLLGGLAWSLSYMNIFIFFEHAGSISIGFSGALLLFVMTTLGGAIPALPGGVGTYEAAAVIALRSLGYSFEEALALSIVLHAAQLILPFIMAMVIMLTERIGFSSLLTELRQSAAIETISKDIK